MLAHQFRSLLDTKLATNYAQAVNKTASSTILKLLALYKKPKADFGMQTYSFEDLKANFEG